MFADVFFHAIASVYNLINFLITDAVLSETRMKPSETATARHTFAQQHPSFNTRDGLLRPVCYTLADQHMPAV